MSWDIKERDMTFTHGHVAHGVEVLWAKNIWYAMPLGFIWYQQILVGHVSIAYIFVHEECRRQKLATRMLSELRLWYPTVTIVTSRGNELSTPWLLKNNFAQFPPEKGAWYLRPPTPAATPAPPPVRRQKKLRRRI